MKRQSSCSDDVQPNMPNVTYNLGYKGNVEATVGKTNLLVSSNALSNSSVLNKSFYCPSRTNKVSSSAISRVFPPIRHLQNVLY